ncbi:MAG: hypothetical protein ABIP97_09430 [Chthoniobacterales bacterium]
MDRYFVVLTAIVLTSFYASAQEEGAKATPPLSEIGPTTASGALKSPPNLPERMRERYEKMPEADRAKFLENFRKWQQMTDEEKHHFRERAVMEKQRIQNAIENAILKSGLTLDKTQREAFTRRYMEERRKVERALRQEMQAKREHLLEDVIDKLRKEFEQTPKSPEAAASPSTPTTQPASTTP